MRTSFQAWSKNEQTLSCFGLETYKCGTLGHLFICLLLSDLIVVGIYKLVFKPL